MDWGSAVSAIVAAFALVRAAERAIEKIVEAWKLKNGHAPHEQDAAVVELRRMNKALGQMLERQKENQETLEGRLGELHSDQAAMWRDIVKMGRT